MNTIQLQRLPRIDGRSGCPSRTGPAGYECRLLDPREVIERVVHLEHATSFLVPELRPELRKLALYRGLWRIERFLKRPEILALRADDSLDRA